jgi:hypothetical protein
LVLKARPHHGGDPKERKENAGERPMKGIFNTIHVARYSHRHGADTRAFSSAEGAERWRQEVAQEWWDQEMRKSMPKAEPPNIIADLYFQAMADREQEYFEVEEVNIEE